MTHKNRHYIDNNDNHYILMNNISTMPKDKKYFSIRIDSLKESTNHLNSIYERIESMELNLTGTMASERKEDDSERPLVQNTESSIMEELNQIIINLNSLMNNIDKSLNHLEEII